MENVKVIDHKGNKIVEMDFQNLSYKDINQIKQIMEESKKVISSQPLGSVITFTNVIGLRFSSEMIEAFKEFTEHNKPYVKFGAIAGITGLQKVAYDVIMKFSGRNIPTFQDRQAALDWIISQLN
jgi:hypothetical protein